MIERKSLDETPAGFAAQAVPISRRALLTGTALLLALSQAPFAFATTPSETEAAFYRISSVLTDKSNLSATTSRRILEALSSDDPGIADKVLRLAVLAQVNHTGAALKAAARAEGLDANVMKIVTAWYTGTIDTANGPVVIAYKDALMYGPVADGLTVPTYCNNGPIWWSGLPPEITRAPVNIPKVL
ncbi:sugar dehydrogenase complex small subunit [Rhizobium sp. P28RR-XV]|uniref:sugar dehydrogenase complex small subunit n=1 Tax=Rhizobium sp. P28RR-XV TaxID=2726737 RepID=UPI001456559A|nr:sugar dehydrogenase complex small subunit [Rhizobium sp. P28RR-XV]NLR88428.1 hypothetical protein [Rhizobium sp. P28RR-XV]